MFTRFTHPDQQPHQFVYLQHTPEQYSASVGEKISDTPNSPDKKSIFETLFAKLENLLSRFSSSSAKIEAEVKNLKTEQAEKSTAISQKTEKQKEAIAENTATHIQEIIPPIPNKPAEQNEPKEVNPNQAQLFEKYSSIFNVDISQSELPEQDIQALQLIHKNLNNDTNKQKGPLISQTLDTLKTDKIPTNKRKQILTEFLTNLNNPDITPAIAQTKLEQVLHSAQSTPNTQNIEKLAADYATLESMELLQSSPAKKTTPEEKIDWSAYPVPTGQPDTQKQSNTEIPKTDQTPPLPPEQKPEPETTPASTSAQTPPSSVESATPSEQTLTPENTPRPTETLIPPDLQEITDHMLHSQMPMDFAAKLYENSLSGRKIFTFDGEGNAYNYRGNQEHGGNTYRALAHNLRQYLDQQNNQKSPSGLNAAFSAGAYHEALQNFLGTPGTADNEAARQFIRFNHLVMSHMQKTGQNPRQYATYADALQHISQETK